MIRGASKNHNAVTVVTDTKQYAQVIAVRGGRAFLVQFIARALCCFLVRAAWTRPAPSSALADAEGCGAEVAK